MNVEIGTVAVQILSWEYLFPIFSVLVLCSVDGAGEWLYKMKSAEIMYSKFGVE